MEFNRLLNNFAYDITNKIQEMESIVEILLSKHPELIAFDKTTIMLERMRIVSLENARLRESIEKFQNILERITNETKS